MSKIKILKVSDGRKSIDGMYSRQKGNWAVFEKKLAAWKRIALEIEKEGEFKHDKEIKAFAKKMKKTLGI